MDFLLMDLNLPRVRDLRKIPNGYGDRRSKIE